MKKQIKMSAQDLEKIKKQKKFFFWFYVLWLFFVLGFYSCFLSFVLWLFFVFRFMANAI